MDINLNEKQWHFLNVLLDGILDMSETEIQERMEKLSLDYLKPPFIVMIVSPRLLGHSKKDKDSVLYSYKECICEFFTSQGYVMAASMDSYDNVRLILSLSNNEAKAYGVEAMALRNYLRNRYEIESFIGIGSKKDRITEICMSEREAFEALTYKYLYSVKGIIDFNTVLAFQENPCDGFEVEVGRVLGCFKDGNLEKMKIRLFDLAEGIRGSKNISNTGIKQKMITIVMRVLSIGEMMGISAEEVLEGDDPYEWIMKQNHTEIIIEWIMEICSYVRFRIDETVNEKEDEFVLKAGELIASSAGTMKSEVLSETIGIDEPYLDQIFRRKKRCTIREYISNMHR